VCLSATSKHCCCGGHSHDHDHDHTPESHEDDEGHDCLASASASTSAAVAVKQEARDDECGSGICTCDAERLAVGRVLEDRFGPVQWHSGTHTCEVAVGEVSVVVDWATKVSVVERERE
jgi:hypothetical protein